MSYESALEAAGAKVIAFKSFGSYQGDWWAQVEHAGKRGWVNGSFGSCSGCDAFEAEFGYADQKCQEHVWEYGSPKDCPACASAQDAFTVKLAAFGADYLQTMFSQEQAEAEAVRNIEWDSDAEAMLRWIKENALPADSAC